MNKLPIIPTRTHTIFKMMVPINISKHNLPLANLRYKLNRNMTILTNPKILRYQKLTLRGRTNNPKRDR
ncbi:hypothetical protein Hanom_Chr02g00096891 [Helianthus anomalus]